MMTLNQILTQQNTERTPAFRHVQGTEYLGLPHPPKSYAEILSLNGGGHLEVEPLGGTSFRSRESSAMGLAPL